MTPINPRPGVVVAITDRRGEMVLYDPSAYRRREWQRNEKMREARREERNAKGKAAD